MEDALANLFFKLVTSYGFWGAIFSIAIVIAITYCFIVLIRYICDSLKQTVSSKFKRGKKIDLWDHQVFDDLQFLMNHKLNQVNTICVIRKKLYQDIMRQRIKCIHDCFFALSKQKISDLTHKQLYNKIKSALDDANTAAVANAIVDGVPKFVLDSMDKKRRMVIKFYYSAIKGHCYNTYLYHSNEQRMHAVLDLIGISVENYMSILEQSLAQFNGNIKTLSYKGVTCANCSICIHQQFLQEVKQEIQQDL